VTRKPKFTFIGDARTALQDLLEYAKENNIKLNVKEWQERASYLKRALKLDYNRNAESVQQAEVMDLLSGLLTEYTKITTGVGNHQMLAAQYLKILKPRSFFTASGFGTMGFALPCAIGVHCANPKATVIAIDGDSSIKMNMGEIHTIGSLDLPIKVLLLNNHGDGMVRNIQDADYQGLHTATERSFDADFAQIAKECGFSFCRKIKHRLDLEPTLREFLAATGPSFLEIVTDRNEIVYPKVPIGKGYKDMILGPFIRNTSASQSRKC
jgi:acetolactate synthase-1/2/3 large subunit